MNPTFAPPPAQYAHVNGPPLEIDGEKLQALQCLANARNEPGVAVSVSVVLNEVIDAYLEEKATKKQLAKIAEQAEADELERVMAVHGGDAA